MVKKISRVAAIIGGSLIVVVLLVIAYITMALPNVGAAPDIKIEVTSERWARGKYLATYVAGCLACHSSRDESKYSAPVLAGTYGRGGEVFPTEAGVVVAPNISSFALDNWTDGEIFRAITCGVNKYGKPLFPLMPYQNFSRMDREDIYSIIAYIRTLKALPDTLSKTRLDFPMNIIVHTIPEKAILGKRPDSSDILPYGKYLITASNCRDCHSPMAKGKFIEGLEYSGGNAFRLANGTVVHSANITFDKETGIGNWSKEMFIGRFKAALDSGYAHPVKKGDAQTIMPWTMYAHMSENDLGAIYSYLKSLQPVKKAVAIRGG